MCDAHVFVEDVIKKGVGFFFYRVFEMRLIVQSEIARVGGHFADFVQGNQRSVKFSTNAVPFRLLHAINLCAQNVWFVQSLLFGQLEQFFIRHG